MARSATITRMTLLERLALHVGRRVSVSADGFSSEENRLTQVDRRFMRLGPQASFVPYTLNEITLYDIPLKQPDTQVSVRVTYRNGAAFTAHLVQVGLDYVEVIEEIGNTKQRFIVPLNKVISIEKIN